MNEDPSDCLEMRPCPRPEARTSPQAVDHSKPWVLYPFALRFAVMGVKCDQQVTALGVELKNCGFQDLS